MTGNTGLTESITSTASQATPDDDRLYLVGGDSTYCDIDSIISDGRTNCFMTAEYCALHINIHSLPSKFDQLKEMLCSLKDQGVIVHFILLCETFLTDANAGMYDISGYSFVCHNRKSLTRGGVAIYILNELNYKVRNDLCLNVEGEFESIAVEVESKRHDKSKHN